MSSPETSTNNAVPSAGAVSPMISMMMAMKAASKETVTYLLAVQLFLIGLAFVITTPLIYTSITSGRFKSGIWLKSSKQSTTDTRALNSITKGNRVKKDSLSSWSVFVHFRRIYNCTMLRMVPFVDLTVGQILVLLTFLALALFGQFYKNLTAPTSNFKRPGWVAVSSLPLLFLLSMKNTPFGILGKGYERVNFLHRFVGRVIILAGLIHGGLWLRMHLSMGQPIVFQGTPLAGLITICAFVVILLSSIKLFRSRFYQTFVALHVLGYVTVLVALWFHKESLRPFVGFAIGTVVLDRLQGMVIHTHVRSAVLTPVPGGMTKIQVENLGEGWRAGQHVYLRVMKGFRMFEKHPFTIANAPSSLSPTNHHQSLVLVAKATGDFTNSLHSIGLATNVVKPNFHEEKDAHDEKDISLSDCDGKTVSVPVAIEGPYGRFYTDMCLHETVVLIAGGSGFTYCSATLEDLIGSYIKGDCMTTKVYVIWALRDLGMTHVFAPAINETIEIAQKAGLDVTFRIHISSSSKYTGTCPIDHAEFIPRRVDVHELMRETLDFTVAGILVRNASRGRGVGVGVCGPTALIASVRNAVARSDVILASKAGGISVHSEMFGW